MQTALEHVFDRTQALLRCTGIFGSLMRLLAVPSSFHSGARELLHNQGNLQTLWQAYCCTDKTSKKHSPVVFA